MGNGDGMPTAVDTMQAEINAMTAELGNKGTTLAEVINARDEDPGIARVEHPNGVPVSEKQRMEEQASEQSQPKPTPSDDMQDQAKLKDRINGLKGAIKQANDRASQAESRALQFESKVATLQEQVNILLRTSQQTQQQQQRVNPQEVSYGDIPKEISELVGEDNVKPFKSFINNLVHNGVKKATSEMEQPLAKQMAQTQESVRQQQEAQFAQQVASIVPDAIELDNDPEFAGWLQSNSFGGKSYAKLYADACRFHDAKGVVELMNLFKRAIGSTAENAKQPARKVDSQISPSKSGSSAPAAPTSTVKSYTMTDFENMSRQYQAGRVSDKEMQAFTNDFNKSAAAGQVTF